MDIKKKFAHLENAEALTQALAAVTSEEEMVEVLKKFGVELNAEEMKELTADELNADDLDDVSGGVYYPIASPTINVALVVIRKILKLVK